MPIQKQLLEPLPALFENDLIKWYSRNRRELPWREISDPYRIWVSEVILQQTRVAQGLDYYLRFLERFPSVMALASANEEDVLRLWQGLGYYSRARNLHAAAKDVMKRFGGEFPLSYKNLRSLKGVGDYTVAAVLSFSQNLPYAVVDGNVYRVLSRLFAIDIPIDSTKGKSYFAQLAQSLLPAGKARVHNQALMEFGALQCVSGIPNCAACSLQEWCKAFAQKNVSDYPVKEKITKKRDRFFTYIYTQWKESVYIQRRTSNDIWKGLFEFPLIEAERLVEPERLVCHPLFGGAIKRGNYCVGSVKDMPKHILSHQTLYARFIEITVDKPLLLPGCFPINCSTLDDYAFPRLILRYLEKR